MYFNRKSDDTGPRKTPCNRQEVIIQVFQHLTEAYFGPEARMLVILSPVDGSPTVVPVIEARNALALAQRLNVHPRLPPPVQPLNRSIAPLPARMRVGAADMIASVPELIANVPPPVVPVEGSVPEEGAIIGRQHIAAGHVPDDVDEALGEVTGDAVLPDAAPPIPPFESDDITIDSWRH